MEDGLGLNTSSLYVCVLEKDTETNLIPDTKGSTVCSHSCYQYMNGRQAKSGTTKCNYDLYLNKPVHP